MKIIDLTFPVPEENLAYDEALLEHSEDGFEGEILRFWEPDRPFVVLGYSGKVAAEVRRDRCQEKGVPIFRRVSGGGTVLQGPGCLNFSLILKIKNTPALENITKTNAFILERHRHALETLLGRTVEIRGTSDLALGPLKFSGNAQRRRKKSVLFHGSFLLKMDIPLIEELLPHPLRQPVYRNRRSHEEFLTNLNLPPLAVKEALCKIWKADEPLSPALGEKVGELVRRKYGDHNWNFKF